MLVLVLGMGGCGGRTRGAATASEDGGSTTSDGGEASTTTGTGGTGTDEGTATESGSSTSTEETGTTTGTTTGPSCDIDPETQECCKCQPEAGDPQLCPPSEDAAFMVRGGAFDWGIYEEGLFDCVVTGVTATSFTLDCEIVGEGTFTLDGITIDDTAVTENLEVRFVGEWWSDVDGCQKFSWFRIEDRMTNELLVAVGIDQTFGHEGDLLDPLAISGLFGPCPVEAECTTASHRGAVRVEYENTVTEIWDGSWEVVGNEFWVSVPSCRKGVCMFGEDDWCTSSLDLAIVRAP